MYKTHLYSYSQHIAHAEEGVMASFEKALKDANIAPQDLNGTFYLIQSNGKGICGFCTQSLFKTQAKKGIFKQFTELYPNLDIIAITSENSGKALRTDTLTVQLKNGKVSGLLKNKEGAEGYFIK